MISRLLLVYFLLISSLLLAQTDLTPERFAFEPELSYRSDIQSPADFLGYEIGESFTLYANSVSYFQYLAEQSDRMTINHYGTTYEGRKLYNVVISSPANLQNIEQLQAQNKKLSNPQNTSAAEATEIIDNKPVFVSYSYNIHGNEASSTEAAMQVSYRLVAATDQETSDILDDAVMIFYICINPDGRDRYVYWYEGMKRNVPGIQPRDLDHYAPWPNGRTNHYWFDLNRDWIWGVHPESRGHTSEYVKWMPQLHTDYHEQGYNNNYFTVPGTTPRNMLLPDHYEILADTIGRANVAAFDKHQINYFTREAFDFFYPGYGSSYPTVMNAIGMLTEQGGIGAGRAIETNDGNILTLRQRAFDHYTTSIATIKKAVERKELFNRYTYETSKPSNTKSSTKSYVLLNDAGMYTPEVIRILLHHDIEVHRTTQSGSVGSAHDYRTGNSTSASIPEGSYVVHTDQPRHLLINTILAPEMTIEDSVMYDMSTWSAPLAYNLDAYSTSRKLSISTEQVTEAPAVLMGVTNPNAGYAYIIDWNQRGTPKALGKLWQKGYQVRSAEEAFSDGTYQFSPGSLIILKGRNLSHSSSIDADIRAIAEEAKVNIVGLNSGRMMSGNDLASRKSKVLKQPRVALMVESPFNTYTCGQLYFLFDQETELPVERVRTSILKQTSYPKMGSRYGYADINDYDVLILAGGGNNLSKLFGEEEQKELKAWIQNGGTVVATESAADFFTKGKSKITNVQLSSVPKDSSDAVKYLKYSDRESYRGLKRTPGTALNGHLDLSHPLAFGLKDKVYSLTFRNNGIKPSAGLHTVGHYDSDASKLHASGYISKENLNLLKGNAFAAVQPMGSGKIVYLTDNTQYRMFWRGPSRMMQNAVMLMPSY